MNRMRRTSTIDMLPFFHIPYLPEGALIELDSDTSHHIAQVLRMKAGESLHVTDGAGSLLTGCLQSVSKKTCVLSVTDRRFEKRSGRNVHLAISPVKNTGRMEWFIEKATELGVCSITPVITQRTEKEKWRLDRIRQIAIAAMLQSQQAWLPLLQEPISYDELISSWPRSERQCLIAHCLQEERKDISQLSLSDEVGILIGPEGDFTQSEVSHALSAGYTPVVLGSTRLRTETAGVVAAAWLRLQQK